jgi:hypothetical protein
MALGFFCGLMIFRGAALYWWTLRASGRFVSKSVHRVLYAPLGFFLAVSRPGLALAPHLPCTAPSAWETQPALRHPSQPLHLQTLTHPWTPKP